MKKILSIILCLAMLLSLAVVVSADSELTIVESLKAGTAYKFGMYQGTAQKQLYFNGKLDAAQGKFLDTTENESEAVDVYLESTTGGYFLYFMDGDTKTYIEAYAYKKEGKSYYSGALKLTTEPENVYTYDTTLKTLVHYYNDSEFVYLGTYGDFMTFSASTSYYVTGANASSVDVTQFIGRFYAAPASEETPDEGGNNEETTKPTTKPTEAPKPVEYHGTQLSKLSDGDKVVIYSVKDKAIMTSSEHTYEGTSYTKVELAQLAASVANKVITYGKGAVVLTVHVDGDKVSFTAPNGKYLYCDGTDVKFVDKAGDCTEYVLETAEDGFFIKCANATFDGKAQYLEVYSGYFTCFSKYDDSDPAIYTFQFFKADPETSAETGDSISVIIALLAVSAMGIAILGKKKEF